MFLRDLDRGVGFGEEQRLAVEDRGGVLHRAGGEIRHGDDVELLERIFDRVVAVEVLEDAAARPRARSRSGASCPASRRCGPGCRQPLPSLHSKSPTASATRYVDIFGVVSNLTVCLPAPGPACPTRRRRSRSRGRLVDDRGQRERRLERRLVERREHPARIGRLELRDGIAAVVRLAQVQAAQIVVEDAVVLDVDLGVAGGNRSRHLERRLLLRRVDRDLRRLRLARRRDRTSPNVISAAFSTIAVDGSGEPDADRFLVR